MATFCNRCSSLFKAPRARLTAAIIEYTGNPDSEEDLANDYNYSQKLIRTISTGALNIEARDGIVQVDVRFPSYKAPELQILWDVIETFGEMRFEGINNPDAKSMPHIIFEALPEELDNTYMLSFTNPFMWFLQPRKPEEETANVVRMFFNEESFEIQKVSDYIDVGQAEAEVLRTYDTVRTERNY